MRGKNLRSFKTSGIWKRVLSRKAVLYVDHENVNARMKNPIVKYLLGEEIPTREDYTDWHENAKGGRSSPMLAVDAENRDEQEDEDEIEER